MNFKNLSCWVVSEGLRGTENQCLAVCDALGIEPVVKQIQLREPWRMLSPWLGFECERTFTPALKPPWPDLLIASGRKSIAASRYIKKQSGGKTFTVQIQDPRVNPAQFDLVAVPEHDPTRGENVIVTTAAPNRITPQALEQGHLDFPHLGKAPRPRVAALIGGNSRTHMMTPNDITRIAGDLANIEASLMITTSRRTTHSNECLLKYALSHKENVTFFDTSAAELNPYMGYLAWADFILVTEDSTSMLSEAASTGKPVYSLPLTKKNPNRKSRLEKLHQNLVSKGCVRPFEGALEEWSYEPLNDAQIVAERIAKKLSDT